MISSLGLLREIYAWLKYSHVAMLAHILQVPCERVRFVFVGSIKAACYVKIAHRTSNVD